MGEERVEVVAVDCAVKDGRVGQDFRDVFELLLIYANTPREKFKNLLDEAIIVNAEDWVRKDPLRVANDLIDDNIESTIVVIFVNVFLYLFCFELQSILKGQMQFLQEKREVVGFEGIEMLCEAFIVNRFDVGFD